MLQIAFRPSCINQASVFAWHKRLKEGRQSVRDDERCGRSKEVNTPEFIKVTMLRFLGSSRRDSVGRRQHSSNRFSGISTKKMHQSTTPSLSHTIWPRWTSTQFLSLPIVQTLLPWDLTEVIGRVQQLHCNWRRLLRRRLQFNVYCQ